MTLFLPNRITDWPQMAREAYEERAGILEFCGNMKREDAEKLAEQIVRAALWEPAQA